MSIYNKLEVVPARNVNSEFQMKRWTPDRELTLTKVPNTIITCRLCRGTKFVVTRHMHNNGLKLNSGDLTPCPNCGMTGIQKSTHIDELWGLNR